MTALANTIVFIIATVSVLAASTYPASATTTITGPDASVQSVETYRDNLEVADRDKTGTLRSSNFTPVPQTIKKQALTRRACLQAERAGFVLPPSLSVAQYDTCERKCLCYMSLHDSTTIHG